MGLWDVIQELRAGRPDISRVARGLQIAGWVCLAALAWNLGMLALMESRGQSLPIWGPVWLNTALVVGTALSAVLFLHGAKAIRSRDPAGTREGQVAILLLGVLAVGAVALTFPRKMVSRPDLVFTGVLGLIVAVILVQVAAVAFLAVRYLGRLELTEQPPLSESSTTAGFETEGFDVPGAQAPETLYVEALVPGGIFGGFGLMLAVAGAAMALAVTRHDGAMGAGLLVFMVALASPAAYNLFRSRFQDGREQITSFTGGGAVGFLNGTWPFFRVLVYTDGIEIRFMFTRFFIPYEALGPLPERAGFFTFWAVFTSDLPGVPHRIRFTPIFGISRLMETLDRARTEYLAGQGT